MCEETPPWHILLAFPRPCQLPMPNPEFGSHRRMIGEKGPDQTDQQRKEATRRSPRGATEQRGQRRRLTGERGASMVGPQSSRGASVCEETPPWHILLALPRPCQLHQAKPRYRETPPHDWRKRTGPDRPPQKKNKESKKVCILSENRSATSGPTGDGRGSSFSTLRKNVTSNLEN